MRTEPALGLLLLLLTAHPPRAAEPIIVRNSDRPLGDKSRRIEFTENLRIGGEEDDDEVFGSWISIAADTKGRIVIADKDQNLVRRYDADGGLPEIIGRGGEGPGEYRNVWTVATDADDNIYIGGQGRISIFDGSGTFIGEFMDESHDFVRSIRRLPDGSILLSEFDYPTHTVLQRYVDGKHVGSSGEAYKFPDDVARHLLGYQGGTADVGPDGMIYYTQIAAYEIRKYTPAGKLVMQIFRENDFVSPPKVEQEGDLTRISGGCGSYGIFVLPDATIMNVVLGVDFTILDLFDRDGRLLFTQRTEKPFHPLWLDTRRNVYFFDRHAAAVVRARMTIH